MIKLNKNKIGEYLKFLQFNLLPIKGQRGKGEENNLFIEDWLTIELAKFFYIGKDSYLSDPIPLRLKGNKNFKQEEIVKFAEQKIEAFSNLDKEKKNLRILQVGRGLDILLAQMQKEWESIICYDEDPRYEYLLFQFFDKKSVYFIRSNTVMIEKERLEDTYVIENRFF